LSSNDGFELSSPDKPGKDVDQEEQEAMIRRLREVRKEVLEMPPPLELIAKTVYIPEEPVKTGAPIAFVNLDKFQGCKFKESERLGKPKSEQTDKDVVQFANDVKPDVQ